MTPPERAVRRPYRGTPDLTAMQGLLLGDPDPFHNYPTLADLPELLSSSQPDVAANTVVWEGETGRIVGFATVHPRYDNLYWHIRPGTLLASIGDGLIAWAIGRRLETIEAGDVPTLDVASREDDAERITFLRRHGFAPTEDLTLTMERALAAPVPGPEAPEGYEIRQLRGESEVEAYVALHRAAFGTENMTVAERLEIMRQPTYLPEGDLVLTTPDGELVAFYVCSLDREANERENVREGEIGIVGTHPAFRGRRLGRTMVLAGIRALREQGVETATLGVDGANVAARRVYDSVGFRVRRATRWYRKALT